MKQNIIKAEIYFDGEYYCARCLNIDVFTQGKSLDEALKNLREAVSLHLEDEALKEYNLSERPTILAMMEVGVPDVSERNQISKDNLVTLLKKLK
ncbi:MAG: type II toxin-antitoxin system HicB family antitoxin [Euryarchaeota archaeon]|nr:type II toxin-antitoxin system HicB family antitoxin [Euryarchaeota archaeon]